MPKLEYAIALYPKIFLWEKQVISSLIIPIPGTKRRKYLEDNSRATEIELTPGDLKELDTLLPLGAAAGERYPAASMKAINL